MKDNERFEECFYDVLKDAVNLGGENFEFIYIGKHIPEQARIGITNAIEHLETKGMISSKRRLDDINGVLDTRDGSMYTENDAIIDYSRTHPSERDYGSNRYDEDSGMPTWDRAYPENLEKVV